MSINNASGKSGRDTLSCASLLVEAISIAYGTYDTWFTKTLRTANAKGAIAVYGVNVSVLVK